ncbi:MAG: tyrosine-type recombinase/integrase [Bacteroidota bacterium]|nr:tyrosine-type recombinase/integrase [Bacteroidota bacterium]
MSFALPEKALQILQVLVVPEAKSEQYLFPFLHGKEKLSSIELYNRVSGINALVNKNLKIFAAQLDWQRNLSFHISRHTFATRALSRGMRIEYVSAILGHSTIQETQRYAKIKSNDLDIAMMLL